MDLEELIEFCNEKIKNISKNVVDIKKKGLRSLESKRGDSDTKTKPLTF